MKHLNDQPGQQKTSLWCKCLEADTEQWIPSSSSMEEPLSGSHAIMPIKEHAEQGVQLTPDCQEVCQEETVGARLVRVATTNVTDWKLEQKEDPVLYRVAKHLRVPHETFKAALHKVLDKKATATYVKVKEQLLIKNGLLYRKTQQGPADEIVFQFVVPQRHWSTALDGCH